MLFGDKLRGLYQIMQFDNRLELLLSRTVFKKTNLNVYRLGGMECVVDCRGGDENGLRYCFSSDLYRAMLKSLPLGPEVSLLDLGANCGGFPLLLHSLGLSLKMCVCVELNPNTFVRLQFNVRHNLKGTAVLLNAGICGTRRTLELTLGEGSTGDNIYAGDDATGTPYRLDGMLFDDVFERVWKDSGENVDLCKMDVEGAEHEVFSNPGHDRLRQCRYLIIEIHKSKDTSEQERLLAEIARLGFVESLEHRCDDVHLFKNTALTVKV